MSGEQGTTGPAGNRARYRVANPREYRSGGVGALYLAELDEDVRDVEAGSAVGLKMLLAVDPDRFAKLRQRSALVPRHRTLARHLESFQGPPLIGEDWDEGDFVYYTAHAWVDGTPLSERMADATPDDFWRWADDLATAVDTLHTQPDGGLAHRDIHAGNVIVTETSSAVLIDFDAMLAGEPHDTSITALISFGVGGSGEGLEGWKAADRSAAARVLLRVLAGDADPDTKVAALATAAEARTAGRVPSAARLVRHLVEAIASPPSSVAALVEGARRTQRRAARRPVAALVAAAVAVVAVVAVVVAMVVVHRHHHAVPTAYAHEVTYAETSGSEVHTWQNYHDAVTGEGPLMDVRMTVQVSCRVQGYQVTDGNVWWYRIASKPWSDTYYGSADAFYNNGHRSGSLHGTPFFDKRVPVCH